MALDKKTLHDVFADYVDIHEHLRNVDDDLATIMIRLDNTDTTLASFHTSLCSNFEAIRRIEHKLVAHASLLQQLAVNVAGTDLPNPEPWHMPMTEAEYQDLAHTAIAWTSAVRAEAIARPFGGPNLSMRTRDADAARDNFFRTLNDVKNGTWSPPESPDAR